MIRRLVLLLILISPGLLAGCATETKKPRGPQSDVSSMPWNRPQPGEGQGMFGGALQRR